MPGFTLKYASYMCSCSYNNKPSDLNVVTNYSLNHAYNVIGNWSTTDTTCNGDIQYIYNSWSVSKACK